MKHLETLERHREKAETATSEAAAALIADTPSELEFSEDSLLKAVQEQEDEVAEAATDAIAPVIRVRSRSRTLTME